MTPTRFRGRRGRKSHDRDVMNRRHDKGLIGDPVGPAKSVVLTGEGLRRSEALFHALFPKRPSFGHSAESP